MDNLITFLEWIIPISAFLLCAFFAVIVLKKEDSVQLFIMGDLEDEE